MKITNVTITNFLTVGEEPIKINLDSKGMVLIDGDNRDDSSTRSNGAGKSTIGDSICWALFNETARSDEPGGSGKTGDDVVNNINGKNCSVEVMIEDAGNVYAITRYRKHKTYKNSLIVSNMTAATDLTKGTDKLTQELVNQLVGCSLEVFRSAIYAAQDAIPNLPGMTDKHLKEIVEEAAGVNRLADAYRIAREDYKARELSASNINTKLNGIKSQLVDVDNLLADLQVQEKQFEEATKKEIAELVDEVAAFEADKSALLYSPHLALDESQAKAEIRRLEEEQSAFIDKRQAADKEVSKAEKAVAVAEEALKRAIHTAKANLEAVKSISDRVGKPCGECGKEYCEEDLESALIIAKKKFTDSKQAAEDLKSDVVAAKSAHTVALDAAAKLGDTVTAVKRLQAAADAIRADLNKVDDLHLKIKLLDERIGNRKNKIDSLAAAKNPHLGMAEKAEKRKAELLVTEKGLKDEYEQALAQVELAANAVKVFSPAGVRAHVLDTVTPMLNDRTSHYLAVLSDGNINAIWNTLTKAKSGELKEKFSIAVVNDKGASSFGGLSGGEKRKVRLATALALQDLVASRASKPIDLFIADEVDDAIDDAGLERLMMLLDEKAREKGTVLMISHNSLSDWCSSISTVIKENGFSRIEGDLVAA